MNKKQISILRNIISEIESKQILFDSDNWRRFQQICVEWGNNVAPYLKPDEKKQFSRELEIISAAIHTPYLPSDESGAPKENAFNKMKNIAKQRLQELEQNISFGAIDKDVIHIPSQVTLGWLFKLLSRLSIGSWVALIIFILTVFGLWIKIGQSDWYRALITQQAQNKN